MRWDALVLGFLAGQVILALAVGEPLNASVWAVAASVQWLALVIREQVGGAR